MTSLMNLRLSQWTEPWEKPCDPLQYLITHAELYIQYLLQTVIAYTADKRQVLFRFHPFYRHVWRQPRIISFIVQPIDSFLNELFSLQIINKQTPIKSFQSPW